MKNYSKPGDTITVDGPVVSGEGKTVGSLFGVGVSTVAAGTQNGEMTVEGEIEVAKLSTDAMSAGDKVNWNNTNKEVQLATSDLDGVATVTADAAASTLTVRVKLTPL